MSRGDKIGWIVMCSLMVLVIFGASWAINDSYNRVEENNKFSGACAVLDGEVEGSVCISDGKVVLTLEEFKQKAGK